MEKFNLDSEKYSEMVNQMNRKIDGVQNNIEDLKAKQNSDKHKFTTTYEILLARFNDFESKYKDQNESSLFNKNTITDFTSRIDKCEE
jgi:hypothetical protein